MVPQNRLRAYDVHRAIEAIVDVGSVLQLRADYGVGIVTALVRVEGVPYGLIANSTHHLGGAIDAEAADKVGDFLALCESFGLPVISLCDTPASWWVLTRRPRRRCAASAACSYSARG